MASRLDKTNSAPEDGAHTPAQRNGGVRSEDRRPPVQKNELLVVARGDGFRYWKMAHMCQRLESVTIRSARQPTQAHPPTAVRRRLLAFVQHHDCLATLQPCCQFAKPALQSYGGEVVPTGAQPPPELGHPLPCPM